MPGPRTQSIWAAAEYSSEESSSSSEESSEEEPIPSSLRKSPARKSPAAVPAPSPINSGSSGYIQALAKSLTPLKAKQKIPSLFSPPSKSPASKESGISTIKNAKDFSLTASFGASPSPKKSSPKKLASLRKEAVAALVPDLKTLNFESSTKKHVPRSKTSTGSTLASDPPPPFSTRLSRPLSTSERTTTSASQPPSSIDSHAAELEFLGHGAPSDTADLHSKTATLVTRDAFAASPAGHYPFKSLLGTVRKQCAAGFPSNTQNPQFYINIASPFSGVLCGFGKEPLALLGARKLLHFHPAIGSVPAPLTGLAFRYGSTGIGQPSEAAYLSTMQKEFAKQGSKAPEVRILVSPSSLKTMRRTYSSLSHVRVDALQLSHSDLNASRLLALMANEDESKIPLYMTSVLALIRAQGSDGFDYKRLREQIHTLSVRDLNEAQQKMLALRLSLLDSFCSAKTKLSVKTCFSAGRLTIIDLSDPFLGEAAACTLFDIMLGLFLESDTGCKGKIIALDEAHTFLSSSSSSKLIASLTSIIRLQRHLGVRTIISTQEPTCIPPAILDLVSFILAHRFSSPAWAGHFDKHVCTRADTGMGWFDAVTNLGIGEACLFSPSMVGLLEEKEEGEEEGKVARIGRGYLVVQIRKRLTMDGGMSVLAIEA